MLFHWFPLVNIDYTLWFEYTMADSSVSPATEEDPQGDETEKDKGLITDISNAPYIPPIPRLPLNPKPTTINDEKCNPKP